MRDAPRSHLVTENAGPATLQGRAAVHLDAPAAERQRRARALRASETRYRRVFETAPYGILVLDGETGVVVDVNPALCDLLDDEHDTLLDQPLWSIAAFKNAAAMKNHFRELLYEPHLRYDGLPLETHGGQIKRVDLISTLFLADGKHYVQCVVHDVTEHVRQEQEVSAREARADQAATLAATVGTHDEVTGLANRGYLDETLSRELFRAERAKAPLSVAMLELEGFAEQGAGVGEAATAAWLREIGRVIQEHLRKSDTACRYDTAKFVMVMPQSSPKATERRIEQLRAALEQLELHHGDQPLTGLHVRTGVAMSGPDGTSAHQLLRAADRALRTPAVAQASNQEQP